MSHLFKTSFTLFISMFLFGSLFAQDNPGKFEHRIGPGFESIELYDKDSEKRIEVFPQGDSTTAYVAKQGDKWVAVINNSIGSGYDKIERLYANDEHYHYFAKKGSKWVMVSDGVESIEFEKLLEYMPRYDSKSKRLAYAGKVDGKW